MSATSGQDQLPAAQIAFGLPRAEMLHPALARQVSTVVQAHAPIAAELPAPARRRRATGERPAWRRRAQSCHRVLPGPGTTHLLLRVEAPSTG